MSQKHRFYIYRILKSGGSLARNARFGASNSHQKRQNAIFQTPKSMLQTPHTMQLPLKKDDAMMPLPGAASVEVATSSARNSLEHGSETAPRSSVERGCETAQPQAGFKPKPAKTTARKSASRCVLKT